MAFPNFCCCSERWSGLNRISHPDWVKICGDANGQIKLLAKEKYEVLSATYDNTPVNYYFTPTPQNIYRRGESKTYLSICTLSFRTTLIRFHISTLKHTYMVIYDSLFHLFFYRQGNLCSRTHSVNTHTYTPSHLNVLHTHSHLHICQ